MKLKTIIFTLIFTLIGITLLSCRENNQQGQVVSSVKNTNEKTNVSSEGYKRIVMICDTEQLPSPCTNDDINLSVFYENTTNNTILTIKKNQKIFTHNMGFFFEGLKNETYVFNKSDVFLIVINLVYEYNNHLLIFQLDESSESSFLGELSIEASEQFITGESINIKESSEILTISVNEKSIGFNKEKDSVNELQNSDEKKLENWFGIFTTTFNVDKLNESHSIKLELQISKKSKIFYFTDGKITKENELKVLDFSKDEIKFGSLNTKDIYIVTKQLNEDYIISGKPIYLINPPNKNYTLKKTLN